MLVLTQRGGLHMVADPEETVRLNLQSETAQLKFTKPKGRVIIIATCTSHQNAQDLAAAIAQAHAEGMKYFCVPSWHSKLVGHVVKTREAYV